MGKPGAKKLDQIVSVTPGDVHIIMIPSPAGPVPTPIPHPCASMIKDKVKKKVKVMGQPGAVKGSKSKHTPPHIPQGGPFQKPPANAGEIFTGSANVKYQGGDAAMLGDTGKMCADPADAPVGKVVGTAALVLVGGGGGGSGEAREKASAAAMKAAAAACHAWINENMPPGTAREQAHRDVCEAAGHPVDVATGKVFTGVTLTRLGGRIPFAVDIDYSTARHAEDSVFGHGWRHTLDRHLLVHPDFVAYRDRHGRFVAFPPLAGDGETRCLTDPLRLRRAGRDWFVVHPDGLRERFTVVDDQRLGFRPVLAVADAFGNEVRFAYEERRLAAIEDTAGRTLRFDRDAAGRVERLTLVAGKDGAHVVASCRYDEAGDLVAVTDAAGNARRFAYDDHLLVTETDRNGFSFHFAYDEERRCVLTWGDGGRLYRRLSYDAGRRATLVTDSRGARSLYESNELGVVERRVDPLGNEWTNSWDDDGHLLLRIDPCGRGWEYAYDDAGDLVLQVDPAGGECAMERDGDGRITRMDIAGIATVANAFDADTGRLVAKTLGDAVRLDYVWSDAGDLAEVRVGGAPSTTYRHDAAGEIVSATSADGATVEFVHDARGRPVRFRDDRGRQVEVEWDALDRVTGLAPRGLPATRWEYDDEGNRRRRVRGGAEVLYRHDAWNAPTRIEGPGCRHPVTVEYDLENLPVGLETGSGGRHAFVYDACHRLREHRFPDGATESYERDDAGRVTAVVDRLGRRSELVTDEIGNVLEQVRDDGTSLVWEYEDGSRLVRMAGDGVVVETLHDDAGRPVGELTSLDGERVHTLLRDEDGYLCWEEDRRFFANAPGRGAWCAAWRAPLRTRSEGDTLVVELPSGAVERQAFDPLGRLVEQEVVGPGGDVLAHRRYAYLETGELGSVRDARRGTRVFAYDAAERLRRVARADDGPDGAGTVLEEYHHDPAENVSRAGGAWEFDAACRLVARDGVAYEHDAAGRRTRRVAPDGVTVYRWDACGRLAAVERDGEVLATFRYDPVGRRVSKTGSAGTTRYGWNGDRLATEVRPDGTERRYLYHGDTFRLLGWVDVAGPERRSCFVHGDHLGRPLEASDEQGRLVWAATCDAYGHVTDLAIGEIDLALRSAGQYLDVETGLCYNRHRYYDPETLRYLSEDPSGLPGGLNPYVFCPNPLREVDPMGLSSGSNPEYDPRQAEMEALRRIYGESAGLQMLTEAGQPGQNWKVGAAQRLLEEETGYRIEPWVGPQGPHGRTPDAHDSGMVDFENKVIYIDPDVDDDTYRRALGHEAGAVKIVEDDIAQTGAPRPASWSEAKQKHIAPAENIPVLGHRTQTLDAYVENPEGFESMVSQPT